MDENETAVAEVGGASSGMFADVPTYDIVIGALVFLFAGIFVYHQFAYPILLKLFAASQRRKQPAAVVEPLAEDALPKAAVIVPAHNEEAFIAAKIENLAALDYPRDRLEIIVALDGCTDRTEEIARAKLAELGQPEWLRLVINPRNIGKLATLNEQIEACDAVFVALSDTSAIVGPDALRKAAAHFAQENVGVVCGSYRLQEAGAAEGVFRDSQSNVKRDEATLAAPIGAHGAFYLFRRSLWEPLPAGTINDDFVLPMRIVGDGARGVYEPGIIALELERTEPGQEFWRRVRIGAGNMQQLMMLRQLRNPRNGWLAWLFLSGKGLRPLAIVALALAAVGAAYMAAMGYWLFQLGFGAFALAALLAALVLVVPAAKKLGPIAWLGYMAEGWVASFLGAMRYLFGDGAPAWSAKSRQSLAPEGQVIVWDQGISTPDETVLPIAAGAATELHTQNAAAEGPDPIDYIPMSVRASKRAVDIGLSSLGMLGLAIVFPFIALAIKLTSKGPLFYSQMRVGRAYRDRTEIFWVHKFRSMYTDAEAKTGAVLAKKNDSRVTPAGKVLRATRLDELPQFINILKGDMSFIGPRPERPSLTKKNEDKFPFFVERTYGLRPGLTGLAQVKQSYEQAADDIPTKVAYDHIYAARLSSWWSWLVTDISIVFQTVITVITRKG